MIMGDTATGIRIRSAGPDDRMFMYGLAPRLAGVADLSWRTPEEVATFQRDFMENALERPVPGSTTLIAEDGAGVRLGFVHAEPQYDPFTRGDCGYISLLATIAEAEGRGIGRLLMGAVEEWARNAGYRLLTLDAFASNGRGRAFYERLGWAEESVRLAKPLASRPGP